MQSVLWLRVITAFKVRVTSDRYRGVSVLDISVRTLVYIDISGPDICILDISEPDISVH